MNLDRFFFSASSSASVKATKSLFLFFGHKSMTFMVLVAEPLHHLKRLHNLVMISFSEPPLPSLFFFGSSSTEPAISEKSFRNRKWTISSVITNVRSHENTLAWQWNNGMRHKNLDEVTWEPEDTNEKLELTKRMLNVTEPTHVPASAAAATTKPTFFPCSY